ncbi:type I-E CRISPR-associated protein Cas7/Cse4/CasC [Desulfonatronum lacustre]|uniref:type I-E CRISPR-associated protein Cas7/Cse4/CasC n=1 Tax=Desulfonatronum lacustre TaxID=66849 RepID=UPI00048BB0E5|nr:type I-E CRISPR-associated protein Cas7/Cse4/CasC [Desulfonatronum lacustre]
MSKYIQLHILTSYPASNLNRDDLGRPKTVIMGNTQRLRVSSQSLKRAWRTSDVFQQAIGKEIGVRTKEMGKYVYISLESGRKLTDLIEDRDVTSISGIASKDVDNKSKEIAKAIAGVFGKTKSLPTKKEEIEKDPLLDLEIEQLAHFSPSEIKGIERLIEECRTNGAVPEGGQLELLRRENQAADIALFGRMLAASRRYNIEAAVQVAHAMTVHKTEVEDDFFTAVDDLNVEDSGAGHMGIAEFGAGLFYLYVCVDRELLKENLGDDQDLTSRTLQALCRAACTISPGGKQNSFASRAYASYCLAEKGDAQPRTLSVAFLKPVSGDDLLEKAVTCIEKTKSKMENVYGVISESKSFNAAQGTGKLDEICGFVAE